MQMDIRICHLFNSNGVESGKGIPKDVFSFDCRRCEINEIKLRAVKFSHCHFVFLSFF